MDMFRLDGKVAIVTGANQGIGAAVAEGFAEAGSRVVLADIQNSEETARRISESTGQEVIAVKTDVTSESDVQHLVQEADRKYGQIDILVNNAGISIHQPNPTADMDIEKEWWPVIDVNLTGAVICTREIVRYMKDKEIKGTIINTASTAGIHPGGAGHAYSVTKAGLINLTKGWALEFAKYGIRVNAVAPGYIRTALSWMWYKDEETYKWLISRIPLGRLPEPEELKGPYTFLASKASKFMTGSVLVVDGGNRIAASNL
jgi:NAD(P)-dependent dehydrogenase (short-subunit alcohol dehydrogenase family)